MLSCTQTELAFVLRGGFDGASITSGGLQQRLAERAERLEAELCLAQQQHQDRELDWAIERAAAKASIQDPEAARLLLRQGDLLEFDEDGKPTNVNAALRALLKERPWLAATSNGPAPSVGNPATRPVAEPAHLLALRDSRLRLLPTP